MAFLEVGWFDSGVDLRQGQIDKNYDQRKWNDWNEYYVFERSDCGNSCENLI